MATDGKKLFLEHFDKMAFGVAGVALLLFLVSMFSGSAAKVKSAEVTKLNDEIKEKKQEASDRLDELKRRQKPPAFQQVIQQELAGGLFPGEMPKWLFHRRPFIAVKTKGVVLPEPEHGAPVDVSGDPGLGRIALTWAANPGDEWVEVQSYKVFRKVSEDGDWAEITEVDGAESSYEDTEVEPRRKYWYVIESHADVDKSNSMVEKHQIELAEDDKVKRSPEVGPFETQRDVYLEVTQVEPKASRADAIEGITRDPKAWIKVYRFFPDRGEWLVSRGSGPYKPEAKVGEVEKIGRDEIDFTTAFKVVETRIDKIRKQMGQEGGSFTKEAHVVKLKDVKTGEVFEINNLNKDQGLLRIKDELKGGGSSKGSGGSGGTDEGGSNEGRDPMDEQG
ncbi:MAG: hypothetical protein ACYTFT_12870 [Planctomycetota bacterium]